MPHETVAFPSPNDLRQAIGSDIALGQIFTEDRLDACQSLIAAARDTFFTKSRADLDRVREAVRVARDSADADFAAICGYAQNMKGYADLFGLSFFSSINGHIVQAARHSGDPALRRLIIIERLTQILALILSNGIDGNSPVLQRQLDAILTDRQQAPSPDRVA